MPPKPKLHKSKGKSELSLSKNKETSNSNDSSPGLQIAENVELQEQFEVELCWCIQQLQRSLSSDKLHQKQVQENTKILNTLMSNSTPFIKKRQVMRLTFGDYRAKMAEENKKRAKGLNMKISPTSPNKNSKFMKKSLFTSQSGGDFKFNFNVENPDNNLAENMSEIKIESETSSKPFHFAASGNDFRFNFNTDQE